MTIPILLIAIRVNIYLIIKNISLSRAARARVEKERVRNDYMRGSSSTGERMRVQNMSETMQEMMEREMAEAIATLNKANSAFDRLFGKQEGGGE
jgi:nucleoid-associated protein YejK